MEQVGLECEAAVFRQEGEKESWLTFSHDTDTGVGGKQLESFWDWIWNWETICERHGQKDREGKGSLMSQYSGSLHVSKNKVLKTLVTEKRGGARSIKISHLENKWHNSSFLVMASLQVVVLMFEADYGSSGQTGSGYVWWLSCWGDVRVPGLMMAAMEATSPHKLCVMHPSLCAVCAYVHVCIWLYMRGVWAWGITRPLCTEHRRLSGWAVWPADKYIKYKIYNSRIPAHSVISKHAMNILSWIETWSIVFACICVHFTILYIEMTSD